MITCYSFTVVFQVSYCIVVTVRIYTGQELQFSLFTRRSCFCKSKYFTEKLDVSQGKLVYKYRNVQTERFMTWLTSVFLPLMKLEFPLLLWMAEMW